MAEVVKFYDVDSRNLKYRNFSGKEGMYNIEGDRNFCLCVDEETAEKFRDIGLNVKMTKPRDEYDVPVPYIKVKVEYRKGRPPKVVQITARGKVELDEDTIKNLDRAEIVKADVALNISEWHRGDRTGVSAYLKTMYVTIAEDDFEDRYYDIPDVEEIPFTTDEDI